MPQAALAIFVKTPELSPCKTRLADDIGRRQASQFYELALQAVLQTAKKVSPQALAHWAVAEAQAHSHPRWQSLPCLATGSGNLGQCQSRVYNQLRQQFDRVLMVGADSPQMSAAHLLQALEMLEQFDFVMGQCPDGGYWLFGGKADIEASDWADVPWSSSQTANCLQQKLASPSGQLARLTDVDRGTDLSAMLEQMPVSPTSAQQELARWAHRVTLACS